MQTITDPPMPIGSQDWAEAMGVSLRMAGLIAKMDDAELAAFHARLRAEPRAREIIADDLADAHTHVADMLAVIKIAEHRLEEAGRLIIRTVAALAACTLLALASPADADDLVGVASVVDGDTIDIHGQRIRLSGIDAPESQQMCLDASGKEYRCGQVAALALDDYLAAHRPTSCIEVDRDRYRRAVAVCTAGGVDIADWMVRQGHALDWPRYSDGAYAAAEAEAHAAKRGVWAGSFDRPWDWRKDRRTQHRSSN